MGFSQNINAEQFKINLCLSEQSVVEIIFAWRSGVSDGYVKNATLFISLYLLSSLTRISKLYLNEKTPT